MERPSRSTIFREMMKVKKENLKDNTEKNVKKLPVHKRRMTEKEVEAK